LSKLNNMLGEAVKLNLNGIAIKREGGGEALAIKKIKNFFWDDYFNLLKKFRLPFSSWEGGGHCH